MLGQNARQSQAGFCFSVLRASLHLVSFPPLSHNLVGLDLDLVVHGDASPVKFCPSELTSVDGCAVTQVTSRPCDDVAND